MKPIIKRFPNPVLRQGIVIVGATIRRNPDERYLWAYDGPSRLEPYVNRAGVLVGASCCTRYRPAYAEAVRVFMSDPHYLMRVGMILANAGIKLTEPPVLCEKNLDRLVEYDYTL